ncbi:Ferrichrome receptor FcuA precursor [Aliarcobacter thereius]|uniref:Ferrichrome receptor FcuA n=1 Tax=Aliarcobacter thereius TaxID=544718 RepID=A0A1C0B542_9BACT|nr:TonB-dependent siderophore receptor [Aliarcobacter thereius]OCL87885.1 Ferrichrome receptor FcuA precursor [Aliarcobacter thereius]OCL97557.1 Ferrichrome receptor FcuA precursor [Aliarcobacter thereius]
MKNKFIPLSFAVTMVLGGTIFANDVTKIEEINVTEKVSEGSAENGYLSKDLSGVGIWDKRNLQDTPYQMSVISSDMIENTASGIEQIFKMNPTVQLNYTTVTGDSWNAIGMNIRGFSVVNNILIDGVPFSDAYTSMSQDLERIEILNGLSGFLYGSGNVGGAINYVTKRPTQERLTNLTLGSTGNKAFYGHLDLGGKIDEKGKLTYRLNIFKQDGETSIKDQKVDNTLFSGALDYKASDNLILSFDASHKKVKTDKLIAAFRSTQSIKNLDPKQGYAPDWTYSDVNQDRFGFKSLWQINDNIKLRTGYIYLKKESNGISQPWIYDNYDGTYESKNYKLFPDEVKYHGAYIYSDFDFDTFGFEHSLTLGASGTKKKNYNTNLQEFISLGNFTLEELNSKPQKPIYNGDSNSPYYLSSNQEKINITIGDDIKINNKWSTLIGLNYVKIENKNFNKTGDKTSSYDSDKITPTLSLIYKPFVDLTTYITYMESLENGLKIDCAGCVNNGKVLDPYVSKQYEIGTKYSVSENLLLSSALFRIEKANRFDKDLPNNMKEITQDGLVIHQGLELTITGKVSDNLTIVGGGTIMDLEVNKAKTNVGKKPTHTASKMAKVYAEYNLPFINGLVLTGGAYYTGNSYRDAANTSKIPSYTIYDAGLRYKTKLVQYPTTFLINATNLTGKKYWRTSTAFGEPRNITFSMKMEF